MKTLFAIDLNEGTYRFRKDKKFYFTDPLIFWLAQNLSNSKKNENFSEKIAEMVAHEFLSRSHSRFGYFSSLKGEVDFILPDEWAIEVKWSDAVTNISQAYKNLEILNKKVWSKSNFLIE
jgi:predicted AAA+ superfamily ATPase